MNTFSSPPNVIREYNDTTYQLPLNSQFRQSPFLQNQSPDYVSLREEDDTNDKSIDIMSSCIVDSVIYKSQKIAGPLLSQISNLNIQQALIIRELLFTLLGMKAITFNIANVMIQHHKSAELKDPIIRLQRIWI